MLTIIEKSELLDNFNRIGIKQQQTLLQISEYLLYECEKIERFYKKKYNDVTQEEIDFYYALEKKQNNGQFHILK